MIEGHRVILRETRQSHSSKGINAMTTAHDIDLPTVLAERLTTCHPDVLRELLATFIHTLMGAEVDALCGAGYGQRSTERTNQRNGYRHREFDTRTGTLDLAIPKLRLVHHRVGAAVVCRREVGRPRRTPRCSRRILHRLENLDRHRVGEPAAVNSP